MRNGRLRLIGAALVAGIMGVSAGCGREPGSNEGADVETGAGIGSDTTAAPSSGASGGTTTVTDTAPPPDTSSAGGTAATPPAQPRADSTSAVPRRDTARPGPSPSAQASRRDTAPTVTRSGDTATGRASDIAAADPASAGDTGSATSPSGGTGAARTPGKTVTQVEYTGWKQYEVNCARCHGEYGLGSTIAPSLYQSFQSGAVDSAEYQRVVHGSRIAKGMPSWKGVLSEDQLHAIYKYLEGRGAGRIAAGRPTPQG